jgi:hypothetical protein
VFQGGRKWIIGIGVLVVAGTAGRLGSGADENPSSLARSAPVVTQPPVTTTVKLQPSPTMVPTTVVVPPTVTIPPAPLPTVAATVPAPPPPPTTAPGFTFDPSQLSAATCSISRSLQIGASGDDVACLQRRLNSAMTSGSALTVDGSFGAMTDSAVRAFQHDAALTVDGIAGRQTAQALGSWSEPVQAATPAPRQLADTGNCHPSYPTVCIPGGPDLDCDDVPYNDFRVEGADPHGFDRDNDGSGCES